MRSISQQHISDHEREKQCFHFLTASWFALKSVFYTDVSRPVFLNMFGQGDRPFPKQVQFYHNFCPEKSLLKNVLVCNQEQLCFYLKSHPSARIYLVDHVIRSVFFFKTEMKYAIRFFADHFMRYYDILDLVSQSLLASIELMQKGSYHLSKAKLYLAVSALHEYGGETETPWLWLSLNEHLGYAELCTHEPRKALLIFENCLDLSDKIFGWNHPDTLKFCILVEHSKFVRNTIHKEGNNILGTIHFIQIWAAIWNTGKFFNTSSFPDWVYTPVQLFNYLASPNTMFGILSHVRGCRVFREHPDGSDDWYLVETSVAILETTPLWEPSLPWNEGNNALFVGTFALGLVNACLESGSGDNFLNFKANAVQELFKFSFKGTEHRHAVLKGRLSLAMAKIQLNVWKELDSQRIRHQVRENAYLHIVRAAETVSHKCDYDCCCSMAELVGTVQYYFSELRVGASAQSIQAVKDRSHCFCSLMNQKLAEEKEAFKTFARIWEKQFSRAIHRSYQ